VVAGAGCIPYPIYKTLQPAAVVTVLDNASRPVEGASVTLISGAYPYAREKSRETRSTDAEGRAAFQSRREWRLEVLMIHGAEVYFWNWCVEKAGYATYASSYRSASAFPDTPTIVLSTGVSEPCHASLK
jgi:hypothetical protein